MTILIGVDQGASGTRAVAFDERMRALGESYQPAHVSHPQPAWIEQDADETAATVERALGDLAVQLDGEVAAAIVSGSRAPWWRADARRWSPGSPHPRPARTSCAPPSMRSAFRVRDIVDALPLRPDVLRVDGG